MGVGPAQEEDEEEAGREDREEGQECCERGGVAQSVAAYRGGAGFWRLSSLQQAGAGRGGAGRGLMIVFPSVVRDYYITLYLCASLLLSSGVFYYMVCASLTTYLT